MQVSTCQISRKPDQNCDNDSALDFPTIMAAVTSLLMLMSQNTDNNNQNLLMIVCGQFHFYGMQIVLPRTILKKACYLQFYEV